MDNDDRLNGCKYYVNISIELLLVVHGCQQTTRTQTHTVEIKEKFTNNHKRTTQFTIFVHIILVLCMSLCSLCAKLSIVAMLLHEPNGCSKLPLIITSNVELSKAKQNQKHIATDTEQCDVWSHFDQIRFVVWTWFPAVSHWHLFCFLCNSQLRRLMWAHKFTWSAC